MDCRPVATPMVPGLRLDIAMGPSSIEEKEEMKHIPYMNAIGALNYVAIATRPDISYAVGRLARYSSNPGLVHWTAVKHLLRYLKGTIDLKLTYAPEPANQGLEVWADADHGGDPDNGRSTSGYIVKLGSGAISWASKLQTVVALSTTKAEYIAAVSAGAEAIWMRQLLEEIGSGTDGPTKLSMDNQSVLSVVKNPEHHGRMKHLDLQYFWLCNKVASGKLQVKYLPTRDMTPDVLTKALPREAVERH
jgi:hypothetical protein